MMTRRLASILTVCFVLLAGSASTACRAQSAKTADPIALRGAGSTFAAPVPRHPPPMELPAIPANAAANGPLQLPVAPGTYAGCGCAVMLRTHNVPNGFQLSGVPPLPSVRWHRAQLTE